MAALLLLVLLVALLAGGALVGMFGPFFVGGAAVLFFFAAVCDTASDAVASLQAIEVHTATIARAMVDRQSLTPPSD